MKEIKFTDTQKKLTEQDFRLIEQDLGISIPIQLRNHYFNYNGGTPDRTIFYDPIGRFDYIEIRDFIPMLYNKDFEDDQDYTLNGLAKLGWNETTIPRDLLPFALDWGGNYLCISLTTEEIYFFARDILSDNLTIDSNFKVNTRLLCKSFNEFIDSLEIEE